MGARIEKIKKWFEVRTVRYWKEEYRLMEGAYNFERDRRRDCEVRALALDKEREGVYNVQKSAIKTLSENIEMRKQNVDLIVKIKDLKSAIATQLERIYELEKENRELKGKETNTVTVTDTLSEEARAAFEDKEPAQCEEVVEEHEEGVVTEN